MLSKVRNGDVVMEAYTHGLDLSGTLEGAGGIGGILSVTHPGATNAAYFYHYDGNGNVVRLTDTNGAGVSTLDYTPFGRVLASTGPYTPRYQFSTKECDGVVGVNYYGYRYYSPELGRWISRDPVGEIGGINIFQFVYNNVLSLFDRIGLDAFVCPSIWDYINKYGKGGPDDPKGTPFDPFPSGSGGGVYLLFGGEIFYSSGSCCNGDKKLIEYGVRTVCGGVGVGTSVGGTLPMGPDSGGGNCPPSDRTHLLVGGNPLSLVPGFGPSLAVAPDIGVTWCPNSGTTPYIGFSFGVGFGRAAICHDTITNPHEAGCCN